MSGNTIIKRASWFDMVTPSERELNAMLRLLYGPDWFRVSRRKWEDLWRRRRGHLNAELGKRNFGTLKGQRGFIMATAVYKEPAAGTTPELTDITHDHTAVSPNQSRIHVMYDSDGRIRWDELSGTVSSLVYADLSTGTDDTNDHTSEWWPDSPDTNEGLNWEIQYTIVSETGTCTRRKFQTVGLVNRAAAPTWHLLDTVSNDGGDALNSGCLAVHRGNGTAKTPETGTGEMTLDIDIRATGSGSSVADHRVDLTVNGT